MKGGGSSGKGSPTNTSHIIYKKNLRHRSHHGTTGEVGRIAVHMMPEASDDVGQKEVPERQFRGSQRYKNTLQLDAPSMRAERNRSLFRRLNRQSGLCGISINHRMDATAELHSRGRIINLASMNLHVLVLVNLETGTNLVKDLGRN
jgi:hypothetical protein